MIEFILSDACNACGTCAEVCPTGVFDAVPGQPPVIARAGDCQTCFMCELYCQQDAIFVGPDAERIEGFDAQTTRISGLMGEMRRHHGWDEWALGGHYPNQHWRMEDVFARARAAAE
ncbi:4Fe-4S dicluster domain-containing protein [Paracoccus litorisediminis]|uniref:Ferredoxin n=1 Tax=Paracoccus litorisediminis TaxID=2006130 RepID=A0A844HLZ1_9RHOB|nr:ferredoxin family protein [Paracoccus litorisediminis]MTH61303.1 ferredoxin [Paracoccus litorisediminis]